MVKKLQTRKNKALRKLSKNNKNKKTIRRLKGGANTPGDNVNETDPLSKDDLYNLVRSVESIAINTNNNGIKKVKTATTETDTKTIDQTLEFLKQVLKQLKTGDYKNSKELPFTIDSQPENSNNNRYIKEILRIVSNKASTKASIKGTNKASTKGHPNKASITVHPNPSSTYNFSYNPNELPLYRSPTRSSRSSTRVKLPGREAQFSIAHENQNFFQPNIQNPIQYHLLNPNLSLANGRQFVNSRREAQGLYETEIDPQNNLGVASPGANNPKKSASLKSSSSHRSSLRAIQGQPPQGGQ